MVLALAASVVQGYASLRGLDAQLDVARQTLDSPQPRAAWISSTCATRAAWSRSYELGAGRAQLLRHRGHRSRRCVVASRWSGGRAVECCSGREAGPIERWPVHRAIAGAAGRRRPHLRPPCWRART
ncbi:hypothetical protein ACU4GD_43955 [Cupriavidus basilensis]